MMSGTAATDSAENEDGYSSPVSGAQGSFLDDADNRASIDEQLFMLDTALDDVKDKIVVDSDFYNAFEDDFDDDDI